MIINDLDGYYIVFDTKNWNTELDTLLNEYQSLLINESSNKADINILLDSSESYMIKREKAEIIIQEVQAAVSQWESLATLLQIPAREMAMFKKRFKLNL